MRKKVLVKVTLLITNHAELRLPCRVSALPLSVQQTEMSSTHWYGQSGPCARKVCLALRVFRNYQRCLFDSESGAENGEI